MLFIISNITHSIGLKWEPCDHTCPHINQVVGFLDALLCYDKENIPQTSLAAVEPYLANPEFEPEKILSKSVAAAGLCAWVINIVA